VDEEVEDVAAVDPDAADRPIAAARATDAATDVPTSPRPILVARRTARSRARPWLRSGLLFPVMGTGFPANL
jgi:hypothetical protein